MQKIKYIFEEKATLKHEVTVLADEQNTDKAFEMIEKISYRSGTRFDDIVSCFEKSGCKVTEANEGDCGSFETDSIEYYDEEEIDNE